MISKLRINEHIPIQDSGMRLSLLISGLLIITPIGLSISTLHWSNLLGLLVVIGGTLGATTIQYSGIELKYAWKRLQETLEDFQFRPDERMRYLVTLSQKVKQDGLIVLDREATRARNPFVRLSLELASDGQNPDEIRQVLETERRAALAASMRAASIFDTMASFAPAMGLIGTLLGLVQMLGSLQDPTKVGPAMSLALLTTLYGAVIANFICIPFAGKLRTRAEHEDALREITIAGVISMRREESPVILKQKLQSFNPLLAAR